MKSAIQNEFPFVSTTLNYSGIPPKRQLLKWIGNKQRFAKSIVENFPQRFNTYFEPFLGSGAILATLSPLQGIGADSFLPLIKIWQALKNNPNQLKTWYSERWNSFQNGNKKEEYTKIRDSYNSRPNPADLLFLCRSCYGGVVRFRQADGFMSTPCGIHNPINPTSFNKRVEEWQKRIVGSTFVCQNFEDTIEMARFGDLIYCDPPYSHSQSILYGAQSFSFTKLLHYIELCKSKGVYVALSIDGKKRSGDFLCDLPIPKGLFNRELFVSVGRSMLKRFQMEGKSLEKEVVHDRLLMTY